jgi:uncharacterized membrane protein
MKFIDDFKKSKIYKISGWQINGLLLGTLFFAIGLWELAKIVMPMILPNPVETFPYQWISYLVIAVLGLVILTWATYRWEKTDKGG